MTGLTVPQPESCYKSMGDACVDVDRIDVDELSRSWAMLH